MLKTRTTLLGLVMVSCLASLAGCNNYEEQIEALTKQNEQLTAENSRLEDRLSALQNENTTLKTDVAQKNRELAGKDMEIQRLKAMKAKPADTDTADGWERGKFGDRVSIGSDLLFPSGSATLTAAGKRTLNRIAADLKGQYAGMPVRVYGYTDSDPIRKTKHLWKDNLDLSANRAMSVTKYLRSRGISAADIETIAMGATNFVASNSSKSGKKRNRRVEIYVLKSR